MSENSSISKEPTPVDDVRLVRERLTREAGGDISKLAEQARRTAERLREKLRFKFVDPPGPSRHRGTKAS
jgi:hypothetical protein